MTTYNSNSGCFSAPDYENDEGSYKAGIAYSSGSRVIYFDGGHNRFEAARDRAFKLRDALRAAGEMGIKAHIGFSGERQKGFPREGVTVGR